MTSPSDTTSPADPCDYCHTRETRFMRIIGRTELDGRTAPTAKFWCGECPVNDRVDNDAAAEFINSVTPGRAGRKNDGGEA